MRQGRVARQLARRRRRERLAGILIAVVGVAVLVVAIVALRNPKHPAIAAGTDTNHVRSLATARTGSASRPAQPSGSTSRSGSSGRSSSVAPSDSPSSLIGALPLIVLNNTTVSGLAAQAAHHFESGGWTVTSFGNLQNNIVSTVAYYDPSVAKAKPTALALQRQYPTIKRVVPRFPQLPAGPIVVVLTPDYSAG